VAYGTFFALFGLSTSELHMHETPSIALLRCNEAYCAGSC
jgi:hypothetical protein